MVEQALRIGKSEDGLHYGSVGGGLLTLLFQIAAIILVIILLMKLVNTNEGMTTATYFESMNKTMGSNTTLANSQIRVALQIIDLETFESKSLTELENYI